MASLIDWAKKSLKEIIDMGYPESVAKRIKSGELPMDEVSRMARADAMTDPRIYYHGGDPNITAFDPSISASKKTQGTGTWVTDDPLVANTYLPEEGGLLYPLRIMTEGMPKIDVEGSTWSNIPNPNGGAVTTDQLARAARKSGESGLVFDNVVDPGTNFKMPREAVNDYLDWLLDYQEKGARNVAVQDPTKIRSVNAAFDPEYKGSNILGSRMAPTAATGLLGASALMGSDDAEASYLPTAVQAAGQSDLSGEADLGRDFGTIMSLLDMVAPLVVESVKPQMMGDSELTDEQRKRGYFKQGLL
jgi:hypothetical protein